MSKLIKFDIPTLYRDRLIVALTRITQSEKYLHLIKNPYYIGEALIHLGKVNDAKRIVESKRKIPKHAYLSGLILYAMTDQNDKLLQLSRNIKRDYDAETLVEYLKQTAIYTGSNTALKILYDEIKYFKPDIKNLPGSSLKELKEVYLANTLNMIHLLRLESPIKGIIDIINQILSEEQSQFSRMAFLSMLTSHYSRWNQMKMNQPYNELTRMLKERPRVAEATFIPIIFTNLMIAGKSEEADRVIKRLLNILTRGIVSRIDKFTNGITTLTSLEEQKKEKNDLLSRIIKDYQYLITAKYRIASILFLLLVNLQNLVRLELPVDLKRIEELVAAGTILTSDIEFVELLFQIWIKQGYQDLVEEEIRETVRGLRDEDALEAFFYGLGKIYANRRAGRIRNVIEKILTKRKRKEKFIKTFIDGLYTETLYIYKMTTES